jgi:hypothetical protein
MLDQLAEAGGFQGYREQALLGNIAPLQQLYQVYLERGQPLLVVDAGANYQDVVGSMSGAAYRYGTESGALAGIQSALSDPDRTSPLVFNYSAYRNTEVMEFFALYGARNYNEYKEMGAVGRSAAFERTKDDFLLDRTRYVGDVKPATIRPSGTCQRIFGLRLR